MAEIIIREFVYPEDYDAVRALWQVSGPGVQIQRSDEPSEILKKLARDPDLFLVAESAKQIIGTVIGGFDGRRGMIYHLAVNEKLREQGIGNRLMKEVEQRLRSKGCVKAYLLVKKGNETALAFYEHQGWNKMESVQLMGKDLG